MIKINKKHIKEFTIKNNEYCYKICKGVYLTFDKRTLYYKGLDFYYIVDLKKVKERESYMLNGLCGMGYLLDEDKYVVKK